MSLRTIQDIPIWLRQSKGECPNDQEMYFTVELPQDHLKHGIGKRKVLSHWIKHGIGKRKVLSHWVKSAESPGHSCVRQEKSAESLDYRQGQAGIFHLMKLSVECHYKQVLSLIFFHSCCIITVHSARHDMALNKVNLHYSL